MARHVTKLVLNKKINSWVHCKKYEKKVLNKKKKSWVHCNICDLFGFKQTNKKKKIVQFTARNMTKLVSNTQNKYTWVHSKKYEKKEVLNRKKSWVHCKKCDLFG